MPVTTIPTVSLPSGETVPILGQGTWKMGEDPGSKHSEAAALRAGLDMGLTLIDTAEMYGDGGAEEVVAEAIQGRRDEVFLVSKFYPHHATRTEMLAACERSLKRLQTDRIDLYLLHWRGTVPLKETVEGFQELLGAGKIRYWGVSNFNLADMQELVGLPFGNAVSTNQVLFNLLRRGIEWDLLPWCREHRIPIMAYSPIEQGLLINQPALQKIASRYSVKPAQVALAWLYQQKGVITIPKAGSLEHIRQNYEALGLHLTQEDLSEIDQAFPPPKAPGDLETI